ncbi:MAG: FtsW/RodA/SpoVE family cell cycle protein [Lewinellaceae bacterium]|nr:FtsW/RodA/SpoVE family cell cycle protein [Lewinellaceae bacterium]
MSVLLARINAELRGDRAIWAILAVMSVFSLLGVYSSTGTLAYRLADGNTEAYLLKHTIILGGGLMLTYLAHLMHYLRFQRMAPYLLAIAIPMLIFTIAFGANINDARRWLEVPFIGITFQTSDFAKLALIIYIARAISTKQDYIKDFNGAFVPIIVPVLLICSLIAPADLSSAVLLFATCVAMMFIGRVSIQYILLLLLLGVVVFAVLIILGQMYPDFVRLETWISRMRDFMGNPDGGYQIQQSKIAIANGGWIGEGPGNSMQRNFLPSPYSDFIYAIFCEEYGIIGGAIIILLYVGLFFRITRLVTKSPKAFGAMVASGLGFSIVVQAFINIAVSVHMVPVTGVTLPMISMGGTSVLFTAISFGIILSVSKFVESLQPDEYEED